MADTHRCKRFRCNKCLRLMTGPYERCDWCIEGDLVDLGAHKDVRPAQVWLFGVSGGIGVLCAIVSEIAGC